MYYFYAANRSQVNQVDLISFTLDETKKMSFVKCVE
jgi:hypothetical protein